MVGSPSELSTFFHNDINTLSRPVASNRAGRDNHSIRVRCCQLLARAKGSACFSFSSRLRWLSWENIGGSRGGARGAPAPPVFLDQSKARRVEKIIWRPPPPPASYHRICMTAPPPPPSISRGLDPALENDPIPRNNFSPCIWGLNEVPVLLKDRIQEFIVTQSEVQPFNVPWELPFKASAMIWRHFPEKKGKESVHSSMCI